MKIAMATTFDATDIHNWSGTPFHMAQAFEQNDTAIEYIGSLKRKLPPYFKLKQFWQKFACGQRESPRFNITAAQFYSEQVAQKLAASNATAVIAPQINPIAYLKCSQKIVLWTDAVYSSLLGFYPVFSNHSASSILQGNAITAACLEHVDLAIFSSDWAARGAIELYGADKNKVKVVPYGANLQCNHSYADMQSIVAKRSRDKIKLLFIGKQWGRKGGDIVFSVAKALHAAGKNIELNFVGCKPPSDIEIPPYIKCHGFISKRTPEGLAQMTALLHESHFLFLPSRAEACAIAFCEANAYALPVLTSYVGGISTVIKDDINGMGFALDSAPGVYCDYITNLMADFPRYQNLALSAFNEYQTRLNWQSATSAVKQLITTI
jgi:glycosyltransferase involved in cell wall biosynthesis